MVVIEPFDEHNRIEDARMPDQGFEGSYRLGGPPHRPKFGQASKGLVAPIMGVKNPLSGEPWTLMVVMPDFGLMGVANFAVCCERIQCPEHVLSKSDIAKRTSQEAGFPIKRIDVIPAARFHCFFG